MDAVLKDETRDMKTCIEAATGRPFWPLGAKLEDICVEDIAHSLAMKCRWNGHPQRFISVAEHSVVVSRLVPKHLALAGLFHDAGEAYLMDIPSPIKGYFYVKDPVTGKMMTFREAENRLLDTISKAVGFKTPLDPVIKQVDEDVGATEARQFLTTRGSFYSRAGNSLRGVWFEALSPVQAKLGFMDRYNEIVRSQRIAA